MKLKKGNFNIGYVGSNFKEYFGEPDVTPKKFTPKFHVLEKSMLDSEIFSEFKPSEITLNELAYILESKEGLLTNGYANIFYIRDKGNILWAVLVYLFVGDSGWNVYAFSVESSSGLAGCQVVSQVGPGSLEPLESHEILITELKYLGRVYKLKE